MMLQVNLAFQKRLFISLLLIRMIWLAKFIDNEIILRQQEICNCFKIGYNAIEELFEISLFMNKLMREQNPATEHDLRKYYPHHYQKIVKIRREGIYNYILLNLKKGKTGGIIPC